MEINKAYLLFEQSGTFKNALKARGIEAEDFDILDDFGETDHVVDLFAEINKAYEGKESIFDQIKPEDIIFAFFPCTRFESNITMHFRGEQHQAIGKSEEWKLEYAMKLHEELHQLYELISRLFCIALRGG